MINEQPAIQAALEQLQTACGFETGSWAAALTCPPGFRVARYTPLYPGMARPAPTDLQKALRQ